MKKFKIPKKESNEPEDLIISPLSSIESEVKVESSRLSKVQQISTQLHLKRKLDPEKKPFFGRDVNYPEELNKLIQPLYCKLCDAKINAIKVARSHYESKSHFKKIAKWLAEWSTRTGEPIPKISKIVNEEYSGSLHCGPCNLTLTSVFDARQHYNGKKHRQVISGISKPSGSGYYDDQGNWIRTPTKIQTDDRFGIGNSFILEARNNGENATDSTSITIDQQLLCKICNVRVTSEDQMKMHLAGSKHLKKVKNEGEIVDILKKETKADLDLINFRTPSGSYYCKQCNITVPDTAVFHQHLNSKKHIHKLK